MSEQNPCTKKCKTGNSICVPCVIPSPENKIIQEEKNKEPNAPDCQCTGKRGCQNEENHE